MKKQLLIGLAKYGLGLALLAYVVWQYWYPITDALSRSPQITPLVLAILLCVASTFLTFYRWYILVRAQDLPFTLMNAIRLGLMGYFLSTFLPGSVGGDIFKAAFLAKEQSRRTVAVATVLLDRAIGLWGLFLLVALVGGGFWLGGDPSIPANGNLQTIILASVGVVVFTVALWLFLGILPLWRVERFAGRLKRIPKVGGPASEFWRAVWMYRCRGRAVAVSLLLAVVGHVGFVLIFYFIIQAYSRPEQFEQLPTLAENYIIVPVGMTAQALFPTPGGVGGGELSFGALYKHALKKPEEICGLAVLGAFIWRLISWGLGLIGYLVYLQMKPALPDLEARMKNEEPETETGELNSDREQVKMSHTS